MIPLEARMLAGLDEFMLRSGHLTVLCRAADEQRGSWSRITREAANVLTRPTPIPAELLSATAGYLAAKNLCAVASGTSKGDRVIHYRYPDLLIEEVGGEYRLVATGDDLTPKVWWQDLCLAEPRIRSRVGAITVSRGKASSKTGLSHIADWSMAIDLISSVGELSPEGRLIAKLPRAPDVGQLENPYFLGGDRIVFGYLLLIADFDVFARLAPKLLSHKKKPIKKADGTRLFVTTVQEISDEADVARHLTAGQLNRISQHLRDLENAVRRRGVRVGDLWSSSTAWHRAASRLETYVDLGLLHKGVGGEEKKYEYVYYPTDSLRRSVESMSVAHSAQDWIEGHLAAALFEGCEPHGSLDEAELRRLIPAVAAALERPTAPLPITALALGLVWRTSERGKVLSISSARKCIEDFARRRPEVARLSRGDYGDRAEFVSFDAGEMGL